MLVWDVGVYEECVVCLIYICVCRFNAACKARYAELLKQQAESMPAAAAAAGMGMFNPMGMGGMNNAMMRPAFMPPFMTPGMNPMMMGRPAPMMNSYGAPVAAPVAPAPAPKPAAKGTFSGFVYQGIKQTQ